MQLQRLPLELVDIITDSLQDDIQSLQNCALSSRSLRFSAQRHLFNTIYLTASSGDLPGSCEALHAILRCSPHIITYIRELRLYVGSEGSDKPLFWLLDEDNVALPRILETLANVRSIHITNLSSNALIWRQIPRRIRDAILAAFSSPRMRSVTLKKVAFYSTKEYMTLFQNSLSLKELYMWVACCLVGPRGSFVSNQDGGYDGAPAILKARPQFETIWIKQSAGTLGEHTAYPDTTYVVDAFTHPRASLDATTNLRKLCVSIHPEDDHGPLQVLLDKAKDLEELVLEVDVLAAQGLDLSRVPKIYLISLFTLNGLNELFYTVHDKNSSRLEELTIEYDISGLDTFFAEMSGFEDIDWEDFESKMLVGVRKLNIILCGKNACPILKGYFTERLRVRLPRLKKRGILKIDYLCEPPSHTWSTHL